MTKFIHWYNLFLIYILMLKTLVETTKVMIKKEVKHKFLTMLHSSILKQ
jgi:hypothetical protein